MKYKKNNFLKGIIQLIIQRKGRMSEQRIKDRALRNTFIYGFEEENLEKETERVFAELSLRVLRSLN